MLCKVPSVAWLFKPDFEILVFGILCQQAMYRNKMSEMVRDHREMVIHIERTGFVVLGRIVMNDSRSEISRFVRTCRPTSQC